ncbi:MAG: hypothetical protein ACI4D3_02195, partial [Lachnospiraceae bacterium]
IHADTNADFWPLIRCRDNVLNAGVIIKFILAVWTNAPLLHSRLVFFGESVGYFYVRTEVTQVDQRRTEHSPV